MSRKHNDPKMWGPKFWFVMNEVAKGYGTTPSNNLKMETRAFFRSLMKVLPCPDCRKHYKKHWSELPIDEYLLNSTALQRWVAQIKGRIEIETRRKPAPRPRSIAAAAKVNVQIKTQTARNAPASAPKKVVKRAVARTRTRNTTRSMIRAAENINMRRFRNPRGTTRNTTRVAARNTTRVAARDTTRVAARNTLHRQVTIRKSGRPKRSCGCGK